MTAKSDFTEEEWKTVLQGPPSAGLLVATAQRGGTFRESLSMAKAYVEARQRHGGSELLDEITAAKPEIDHTRFGTVEELKQHCLQNITDAVGVLAAKGSPEEVDDYRGFVKSLAEHVAEAHREGLLGLSGERVSDAEREALEEIAKALDAPAA